MKCVCLFIALMIVILLNIVLLCTESVRIFFLILLNLMLTFHLCLKNKLGRLYNGCTCQIFLLPGRTIYLICLISDREKILKLKNCHFRWHIWDQTRQQYTCWWDNFSLNAVVVVIVVLHFVNICAWCCLPLGKSSVLGKSLLHRHLKQIVKH